MRAGGAWLLTYLEQLGGAGLAVARGLPKRLPVDLACPCSQGGTEVHCAHPRDSSETRVSWQRPCGGQGLGGGVHSPPSPTHRLGRLASAPRLQEVASEWSPDQ